MEKVDMKQMFPTLEAPRERWPSSSIRKGIKRTGGVSQQES